MKHGCFAGQFKVAAHHSLIGAVLLISLGALDASAGEIRIWPTASVQSKNILLGDIAELAGFDGDVAKHLSDTVVFAAPCAGGQTHVAVSDVRGALSETGSNMAEIQFIGAARCKVTRPRKPKPMPRPLTAQKFTPKRARLEPQASQPRIARPEKVDNLESLLREFISARLSDQPGKIDVRFSPVNQRDLALPVGAYQFSIHPQDPAKLGLASFDVNILHPDEDERVVPILAEISLLREVVTAKREINRGQPVEGRDLALEERRFQDASAMGIADLNLVVGQRAREIIRRGDMVTDKLVEPKPIVLRGDAVTVWMRQGGLTIKTSGRAQQAGGLGDKIEVRREGTKRKQDVFDAIVTGPGTVTLGEGTRLASR